MLCVRMGAAAEDGRDEEHFLLRQRNMDERGQLQCRVVCEWAGPDGDEVAAVCQIGNSFAFISPYVTVLRYSQLPFTQLRLGMRYPVSASTVNYIVVPYSASSLYAVIQPNVFMFELFLS